VVLTAVPVLVNDRLVVLRLRKCATAQVVTTVKAVVGGEFHRSRELGRDDLTSHGRIDFDLDGRRVLGTVRDPWSWYVSLWAYGCEGLGGVYARVAQERSLRSTTVAMVREARRTRGLPRDAVARFRRTPARSDGWRALYADVDDPVAFRTWLARVLDPEHAGIVEPWYGSTGLPPFVGLLTWRYLALFGRDPAPLVTPRGFSSVDEVRAYADTQNVCDDIVRTDRIADELPGVLVRAGFELDDAQRAALTEMTTAKRRRNSSKHRATEDYYDPASIELVAARERIVIERHAYVAPVASRA
jgi:hypothetical protein